MTPEEIKLGYLLLEYLRISARDRAVHKFNVLGRSTKGEFEMWLRRDVPPDEKQTLIWLEPILPLDSVEVLPCLWQSEGIADES